MHAAGLSKSDVRQFIFQNARMSIRELTGLAHYANRNWPSWINESNPNTLVPMVLSDKDIEIFVSGGDGRHSAWLAGWGVTRVVTEKISMGL